MNALAATLLALTLLVVVPVPASAEPCEVPGCNLVGAAACFANEADRLPKEWKQVVVECTTQTA